MCVLESSIATPTTMFGLPWPLEWTVIALAVYYAAAALVRVWTASAQQKQVAAFQHKVRMEKRNSGDKLKNEMQSLLDAAATVGGAASARRDQRILALVNPHGGSKTAPQVYANVFEPMCRTLGVTLELQLTTHAGHAINIARAAAESGEIGLIVCFSGDGMVHEVIKGVVEAAGEGGRMTTPLAIMPCGTSNGLAMSLYGTVDPCECADKILTQCQARSGSLVSLRSVDATTDGDVFDPTEHYDVMGVSQAVVGDANYICEDKLRWMNNLPFGGAIKEGIAAVYLILLMRKYHVHIAMRCLPVSAEEVASHRYRTPQNVQGVRPLRGPPHGASSDPNGEWFEVEHGWTWCETSNISHIAKDCQTAPGSKPSDPHMDLLVSRGHNRFQLAASFLRAEHGTHIHDDWFQILKVAELVFTPRNASHQYYMSGELAGTAGQPIVCRCLPDKGLFWY